MPAEFVSPSYSAFASNRGGGGGGGGIVQLQDSTGDNQAHLQEIGLQGLIQGEQSNMRFVQQGQLQAQQASLNAWQYQQQVTTNEQMQMRQDQNAIAAVDSDPTLSDLEKMQAKTRIKTRIDWVGERQKRDYMAAQVEQAQAQAQDVKQRTELEKQRIAYHTQSIGDKLHTVVDDDAVIEIGKMIEDMHPGLKEQDPVSFSKMVEQEAVAQKRATRYATDEHGNVDMKNGYRVGQEPGTAGARSSTGTGTGASKGIATDESVGQSNSVWIKANEDAIKAAGPGASVEQIKAYRDSFIQGHIDHMDKYKTGTTQGRIEAAGKTAETRAANIDQQIATIRKMPGLPTEIKDHASNLLSRIKNLEMKYPLTSKGGRPRPEMVQKQIDEYNRQYNAIENSPRWQQLLVANASGQVSQAPPADNGMLSRINDWTNQHLNVNDAIANPAGIGDEFSKWTDQHMNVKDLFR